MKQVILNGCICEPMSGGYWSMSYKGKTLAWLSKDEVRALSVLKDYPQGGLNADWFCKVWFIGDYVLADNEIDDKANAYSVLTKDKAELLSGTFNECWTKLQELQQ